MEIVYITLLTIIGTGVIGLLIGKVFGFIKTSAAKTENKLDDALVKLAVDHQDELVEYLEKKAKDFLQKKVIKEEDK